MNMQQLAAQELYNRRMARRGLLGFTQYTFPAYQAEPAHALIAQYLDAVVDGDIKRLIITAPPQHGKSELTSVRLPAYWLGRRPDDPVIIASYAASLAEDKSRQARNLVESDDYQTLFPDVLVDETSRAVDHWKLAGHRGYVRAVGVGGGVTGHGAMLAIVDDPVQDNAAAQSETIRRNTLAWYKTTLRTRVWAEGALIVMATRWHENDLIGSLLEEQPGQWEVLRLPAIAETQYERDERNRRMGLAEGMPDPLGREPGEPLMPGRYPSEALEELREDVGNRAYHAQYQGAPTAAEGDMFKREWFRTIEPEAIPKYGMKWVRYWDKAGTAKGGAYTAGTLMGFGSGHTRPIVADVQRGQWGIDERDRRMKQTAQMDVMRFGGNGPDIWVEQEPGSAGKESAMNTIRMLAGYTVRAETASGEKEVRAQPLASYASSMGIDLVRGGWNAAYLDEMLAAPHGTYWDQIDSSAGAFNKLSKGGAWGRGYAGKNGRE